MTFLVLSAGFPAAGLNAQTLTATEIVRMADEKWRGEKSGFSEMSMTIVRPTWQRTVDFRSWSLDDKYSLTLITAPARDKGETFLKRGTEMWSYNPVIDRLIKLPPSLMSQGWMGSDYTNDDILRESSVVNDYTHEFAGEEEVEGRLCYKITMNAKKDANTLWSRRIWWIDKKELIVMKEELFDEDGYLVRTETCSDLKLFDGRLLPSVIELVPADSEGKKTIVKMLEMKFDIPLSESFFSQENMRNVR